MIVRLVSDVADSLPGVDDHARYLQLLSLALGDPSCVPLVLHAETRRGIGIALSELLLYSGRVQPTPQLHLRAPLRNESGRVVVALRETRQNLFVSPLSRCTTWTCTCSATSQRAPASTSGSSPSRASLP